ncbi:MAG: arsenite S-adenosylmethyltransferase [Candidatus Solibacter sp.]|nr:arsenite S-adenosylmethyltransferase [Candidatus Solibacter sp.]
MAGTNGIKEAVRERYASAALKVVSGGPASCCGGSASTVGVDPISSGLYDAVQKEELPEAAVLASLGCGNPTALAELKVGETVLDLGSGGGIDVLLSARRVGPTGFAYGLDMTDEMLNLARVNARKAGAGNVEFLRGEIEAVPLPEASVDVIISNCVINLSADKDKVLKEAFRVLKPGGRFAVSDVVHRGSVPEALRKSLESWAGCVAGSLEESDYKAKLAAAGFVEIAIDPTRVYSAMEASEFLVQAGLDPEKVEEEMGDRFFAAFIRARKPV